jgi:hypothetical protein
MGNLSWRDGRRNITLYSRNLNTVTENGQALYTVTKKGICVVLFPSYLTQCNLLMKRKTALTF